MGFLTKLRARFLVGTFISPTYAFDLEAAITPVPEKVIKEMKKIVTKDQANRLLFDSIYKHFSGTVQLAVSLGADINKEFSSIPLLFASSLGDVKTVRVLIKNGADIHITNSCGETALMKTAWSGHTKTADLLIKNRAVVDVRCNKGKTALMYASMYGRTEMVELLIKKGADITAEDFGGRTAFRHAVNCGNVKIARLLIQKEADFNREFTYAFCHSFDNTLKKTFMEITPQTMKPEVIAILRELCKSREIGKEYALDIFHKFNWTWNNAIKLKKPKLKKPKGKPNSEKLLRISI
ncbi:ankyrin repeat domain-containing protein [Candidatus Micrarchaeota archaeon]|nr:ankyrin repeat domain-containing protein [Candidatus Micrarchaeota archaeon]